VGLREDKKRATRTAIADAALGLFLDHGFEAVTVVDVAEAAGVSAGTVFNYFATKEDLFLDRGPDVADRLAGAVRARAAGTSVAGAVRALLHDELRRGEPTLGLDPGMARFWAVVEASPTLVLRLRTLLDEAEAALAVAVAHAVGARAGDPLPAVVAAALAGVERVLHAEIRRRVSAGQRPATVRAAAHRLVDDALDRLDAGLLGYG
jgi:AcrR family transcriptional regulator